MRDWWRPPVFADDDELNRRAAVVYPVVLMLAVVTPISGAVAVLLNDVEPHFLFVTLAATAVYTGGLWCTRRGHVSATAIVVVLTFAADGLFPLAHHGLSSASFASFVIALVIASATLPFRFIVGLGLGGAVALLFIGTAETNGRVTPMVLPPGMQLQTYLQQLFTTVVVLAVTTPAWRRWIRELRTQKTELQSNRHQFAELVRHSPSGILQVDDAGVVRLVNPAGEAILGLSAEQLVGRSYKVLEAQSQRAADLLRHAKAQPQTAKTARWRFSIEPGDGATRVVEATAGRIEDGVMATFVDVSDQERVRRIREELEQRKGHAMRLEALGRMAGGIAHDFNNLLTVIASGVDLVEEEASPLPEIARQDLDAVRSAARKAAELTSQLLAFGRRQPLDRRAVDGADVLESVARLMRRTLREHVKLEVTSSREPCAMIADRQQLERVLVNLITNARDAMNGPGRITLGVRPAGTTPPRIELVVSDTGHGMDPATCARIFEPFFTTKEPGRGTGLGLATVHGIVAQLGGTIHVRSAVGRGTTFRILLPAATAASPPLPNRDPPVDVATTHRPLGILLVEDEEPVRRLLGRTLEQAGHEVWAARGVDEGLGAWTRRRSHVDLLVTDVILGDGTGPELVEGLRERGFSGPVLYVTGYPGEVLDEARLVTGALLMKPFRPDDLVARVEALWASSPAHASEALHSTASRDA